MNVITFPNSSWRLHQPFEPSGDQPAAITQLVEGIGRAGLKLPDSYPNNWVAHCKAAGSGQKALVYLGRYLYRGVLPEKDIVANRDGKVTFRYRDSETGKRETRTLPGVEFLRKILLHVLPKGFRRARNFGFLHHNSKLVKLVQLIKQIVVPPPRLRLLRQADAGRAHAGEVRGCFTRPGVDPGDCHVNRRTPQSRRARRVRPNSPRKRPKTGKTITRVAGIDGMPIPEAAF